MNWALIFDICGVLYSIAKFVLFCLAVYTAYVLVSSCYDSEKNIQELQTKVRSLEEKANGLQTKVRSLERKI
jgi:cell division protein FtsL